MTAERRLLSAEEIASAAGAGIPFLLLPEAGEAFAQRARRLRALAPGHAAGAYLSFVADLADAQQRLLDAAPPASADAAARAQFGAGLPPLQHGARALDPAWRELLAELLRALAPALDAPARAVAERLLRSPGAELDLQAGRLLGGVALGIDTAAAPFIGAALQVHYTRRALALDPRAYRPIETPTLCPCCGSRPTASIVRIGGDAAGLRYLACSLCSAQWHMVRISCPHCRSTKGISYRALQRDADADTDAARRRPAVQAEVCDECGTYTKICHMDRDLAVDPYADDLASLPLDLLMGEAGYSPWGVNFMLLHGDPDAADAPLATETLQ